MPEELATHVDLKIGDKSYRLTPSPRALMRVCKEIGDPMLMVLQLQVGAQPPELVQVFRVLRLAMDESGCSVEDDEFEELMFKSGVENLYVPYAQFVGALVNSGTVPSDGEKGGNRKTRRAKKARGGVPQKK